jgi:hypothetical protein
MEQKRIPAPYEISLPPGNCYSLVCAAATSLCTVSKPLFDEILHAHLIQRHAAFCITAALAHVNQKMSWDTVQFSSAQLSFIGTLPVEHHHVSVNSHECSRAVRVLWCICSSVDADSWMLVISQPTASAQAFCIIHRSYWQSESTAAMNAFCTIHCTGDVCAESAVYVSVSLLPPSTDSHQHLLHMSAAA